tara:strand:- start:949 stop:1242 length:294 start_codon:yes stop_codon:yes gene_type:complete
MQKIDQQNINSEFYKWTKEYGSGRNFEGLSFYEHIQKKYNIKHLMLNKKVSTRIENAEKFYICIMQMLICPQKNIKTFKIKSNSNISKVKSEHKENI